MPIRIPRAIFRTRPCLVPFISSPSIVPRKGPMIMPRDPKVAVPRNDPKDPPKNPHLLTWLFLATSRGTKRSKANVSNVTIKKITIVAIEILSNLVPIAKINNPSQAIRTPGKNGKIIPANPTRISTVLITANITLITIAMAITNQGIQWTDSILYTINIHCQKKE